MSDIFVYTCLQFIQVEIESEFQQIAGRLKQYRKVILFIHLSSQLPSVIEIAGIATQLRLGIIISRHFLRCIQFLSEEGA